MNPSNLIASLSSLISEERNPATMDIDLLPAFDIVKKINEQDKYVAFAVEKVLPEISLAVNATVAALQNAGRLVYLGAGTSGRLGVLDAVECRPTYSVPDQMVVPLIAGGEQAMFHSQEGVEDNPREGVKDLENIGLCNKDLLVGITASGRTPYVIGGLQYARSLSAKTVALTCNPNAEIAGLADITIAPVPGPEVLSGSTRMKSGTAQKMVLNMLTTASMIRLGKSFHNLMVDVSVTNDKLRARALRIVMQATGAPLEEASHTLKQCQYNTKQAILMLLTGLDAAAAAQALRNENGFLRRAVEMQQTRH